MDGMSSSKQLPEEVEGGVKELVLRWFKDTQASLALDDGNFPGWFQGFTARKDAEDLLKDKDFGTFLVRLSDKTIGYILSYRGQDRCRHFVITQNQDGLFVVSGDDQTHGSISELIEHYKISPILPFGEYLTSSCHQTDADELYDVVNHSPTEKSGVSVRALRSLWDQKDVLRDPRTQRRLGAPAGPPPSLPQKSKPRKLTGTVSAGAASQVLPPVPRRGLSLGFSFTGSSPDTTSSDAKNDSGRAERLGGNPNPPLKPNRVGTDYSNNEADWSPPEFEQVENMSRSPRSLNSRSLMEDRGENDSNRLSSPTFSFDPPKRVSCQTYSLHDPRPSGSRSEPLHMSRSNPLYQSAERSRASPAQQGDGAYAEIPHKPAELPEDTYESLDDLKARTSKNTWGTNNIKWKKFLNDYVKK